MLAIILTMKISFKRSLTICLSLLLFLGNFSVAAAASFSDVPDNHPNFQAVEFLKQFKVVNGYNDGTFKPNNKVNRSEALKMILLAGGVPIQSGGELNFKDVQKGAWFYDFVQTAVSKNIVAGYSDSSFKPDKAVNLAEALKMSFMAYNITKLPTNFDSPYLDVSKDAWFAPYASFTAGKNITQPRDDGFLHPEREITRAELAEILYRFRYVANHNMEAVPFTFQWKSYQDADLNFQTLLPAGWELIINPKSVVMWKKDPAFTNVHYEWVYPNSANIIFTSYENKEGFSKEDFFEQLKLSSTYAYDSVESNVRKINKLAVLEIKKKNGHAATYIFEMPNKKFLVVFSDYGGGQYAPFLKQMIEAAVNNVQYFEAGLSDAQSSKSKIFANILVEGKSKEMLEMLKDEILIETDTLGVGTGPVDYYYSSFVNLTLKIDRNSATILDTRDGETSAF